MFIVAHESAHDTNEVAVVGSRQIEKKKQKSCVALHALGRNPEVHFHFFSSM